MKIYYGTLKNGDTKYDTDWTQMRTITGIQAASSNYWLASRYIDYYSYLSNFIVRFVLASGSRNNSGLCLVDSSGYTNYGNDSNGFRPVFTLNSGIEITEGDGDEPYTLLAP